MLQSKVHHAPECEILMRSLTPELAPELTAELAPLTHIGTTILFIS